MALLVAANSKRYNMDVPSLPVSQFYNIALDIAVDPVRDFLQWQQYAPTGNQSVLSFCQYPFLLSLAAKISILVPFSSNVLTRNYITVNCVILFLTTLKKYHIYVYCAIAIRRADADECPRYGSHHPSFCTTRHHTTFPTVPPTLDSS
jgi:hypothetical protein